MILFLCETGLIIWEFLFSRFRGLRNFNTNETFVNFCGCLASYLTRLLYGSFVPTMFRLARRRAARSEGSSGARPIGMK